MSFDPRFLFRGTATALNVNIRRKHNQVLNLPARTVGTVALPITGGSVSETLADGTSISFPEVGRVLTADFIHVEAHGDFDPPHAAASFTTGNAASNNLPTVTKVLVEIHDLQIFANANPEGTPGPPRVTVGRIRAEWEATHARQSHAEPRITFTPEIDDLRIDGHAINVAFAKPLMGHKTFSGLKNAYENNPQFRQKHAKCFGENPGNPKFPSKGNSSKGEVAMCTVVESLSGGGPNISIQPQGHKIHVPQFGMIHLGEMLISADERRATILRIDLGSPTGGDVGGGDSGSNGSGWPP